MRTNIVYSNAWQRSLKTQMVMVMGHSGIINPQRAFRDLLRYRCQIEMVYLELLLSTRIAMHSSILYRIHI